MNLKVHEQELNYDRAGLAIISDGFLLIDGSGDEYGLVKIPLDILKEKIKEYEQLQASLLQSSR